MIFKCGHFHYCNTIVQIISFMAECLYTQQAVHMVRVEDRDTVAWNSGVVFRLMLIHMSCSRNTTPDFRLKIRLIYDKVYIPRPGRAGFYAWSGSSRVQWWPMRVIFASAKDGKKTYALYAISVLPRSRHLGLAYVRKTAIGRIARKISFMAIATFMTTTARIYVQTYAIYRLLLKLPTIICMCC